MYTIIYIYINVYNYIYQLYIPINVYNYKYQSIYAIIEK